MSTLYRQDQKLRLHCGLSGIDKAKRILGATWNKRESCWEYPLSAAPFILEAFPKATIDESAQPTVDHFIIAEEHVSKLVKGEVEPRAHPFLMKHQRLCLDISLWAYRYALFLDTGTGKTLAAYAIIADNQHLKWLVICPKSIVRTAWMDDHNRFYPKLRVLPCSKNIKKADYIEIATKWGVPISAKGSIKDIRKTLLGCAEVVIINPESFKSDNLDGWAYEGLIVDESSIMRNIKSQITVALLNKAVDVRRLYLLSGKPAPNSELEYFPQMVAVNPALFGGSYYKFRDRFFEAKDYFGYDFQMRDSMRDEFARRLAKGCIFVSKKDCLDLPDELPPVARMVELGAEARKYYKTMEREQILLIEDTSVAARTKLAALMKLRQITSGFIIDTEEDGEVVALHSDKLAELKTVIEELGDNKAIIWVNFKREVHDIAAMLAKMKKSYVTAYSETTDTDLSIADFKSNAAQFIIAHPKTLKYGVTFTGESMAVNCTFAIYYSMSYSYEDYYQSHDRIYRKGQNEGCTYIFLIAENTIDEDIYEAIIKKGSDAAVMENMIRRCHDGEN